MAPQYKPIGPSSPSTITQALLLRMPACSDALSEQKWVQRQELWARAACLRQPHKESRAGFPSLWRGPGLPETAGLFPHHSWDCHRYQTPLPLVSTHRQELWAHHTGCRQPRKKAPPLAILPIKKKTRATQSFLLGMPEYSDARPNSQGSQARALPNQAGPLSRRPPHSTFTSSSPLLATLTAGLA